MTDPRGVPTNTDRLPDDPTLVVSLDWATGCLHLRGDLDRGSAHHLQDALTALLATDHVRWTLDASQVTFCDAGGLRALTAASRAASAAGRELRLGAASRCVTRLLTLTGQTGLFGDPAPPPPVPGAHDAPVPGRSVPGRSVPGRSAPGLSVPGRSAPRTGRSRSTTTPARPTVLR